MFYLYVLFSSLGKKFYIGSTSDLRKRYTSHLKGENFATKNLKDWKLVYYEAHLSRKQAFHREQSLKKRAQAWRALKKRIIEDKE